MNEVQRVEERMNYRGKRKNEIQRKKERKNYLSEKIINEGQRGKNE